jgi:hypothetical protein
MLGRSRLFPAALGALGLTALAAVPAAAASFYPVNKCVSTKQREAADYCRKSLRAWAAWDVGQDAGKRDAALARAATGLTNRWTKAENASADAGSDCGETTASSSEVIDAINAAVAGIVADVNDGLDLGSDDAKCGATILRAAAAKCGKLLQADAKLVNDPSADPHRVVRGVTHQKAHQSFTKKFNKAACDTNATVNGVELQVDQLEQLVFSLTTVSPNVSQGAYDEIAGVPTEYQGRTFTPVCKSGTPYAFFARRGTVNKLVVYYQGGGACWENVTCSVGVCDPSVGPGDNPNLFSSGFGDLDNPDNPFKDWNAVFVSYCSCDIHFGDAAQDYTGLFPPIHVEHRGFHNSKVVEKWAREHFVMPDEVFVTGSSAGAYGAWFHGPLLHLVYPASRFNVLADAGNGVVTQEFLENEFPNWNFEANLPPQYPQLAEVLHDGTGIPGYTKAITDLFPETRWAHYSTAYDGGQGGQSGFYNVMLHPDDVGEWTQWWNGACPWNEVMVAQAIDTAAAVPSNYRYYIGTGSRHTMWGAPKVYTDTTGGVPTIVSWINAMLHGTPQWTNVECTNCGLLLPGDVRPNPLVPPFFQQGSDVVIDCDGISPGGAFLE